MDDRNEPSDARTQPDILSAAIRSFAYPHRSSSEASDAPKSLFRYSLCKRVWPRVRAQRMKGMSRLSVSLRWATKSSKMR